MQMMCADVQLRICELKERLEQESLDVFAMVDSTLRSCRDDKIVYRCWKLVIFDSTRHCHVDPGQMLLRWIGLDPISPSSDGVNNNYKCKIIHLN